MNRDSSTPRRRGIPARLLPLVLLATTACSDEESLAPGLRVPELGSYAYDAVVLTGDSVADTLSGSFTIFVASEDSIVGVWAVPGYTGASQLGRWDVNSYTVPAQPSGPDGENRSMIHRVARRDASVDLECGVAYRHVLAAADTFTSSISQNDCSLLRE